MQTGIANLVQSAFILASCHCVSRDSRKCMVETKTPRQAGERRRGIELASEKLASDCEPDQPL